MKLPKLLQANLALLLVTVIWGCTFIIARKGLTQTSPVLFMSLRFWAATAVAVALMPGALRNIPLRTVRRGIGLSIVLMAGFILQTVGLRRAVPSTSAFITSLYVLFVPVFAFLLFRRRPAPQTIAGVALAVFGLGLLTLDTIPMRFALWDGPTLLCAIVFALYILLVGRYVPTSDCRQLVILQLGGCALLCTLVMPLLETRFLVWDRTLALYLLVTGVLGTGLTCYLQNWAQQFISSAGTALILSLAPFITAVFARQLLGDSLPAKVWAGGGLVLLGAVVSQLRRTADQGAE